ncbi:isochorismatase family protein [Agreia sp. Leaf283]|uniref:isochorismatase family protein n=1 Tax=Agreia sp. Leaf283 TaxID=1736321 RepID=UPI0006F42415|nr:isochorismatase family protein [Agreia sp. Leaf283]KQP57166.1 isochorismatase [Agreia sp. Leaf283]
MTDAATTDAATTDATTDYESAGFAGRLALGRRPALVLVDPALAYVDPECPLYAGVEDAADGMRELLSAARAAGIPVFVTRVVIGPADGGVFRRKVPALKWLDPESPYSGYIDGLEPLAGETVVTKQYPSAFAGTSFAATLTALGIDTLVIGGLSTSGCIRATATDAMQAGFVPVVVREAVGDRLPGPHEANLFDIQAKIGEVVSLDEVRTYLAGTSR